MVDLILVMGSVSGLWLYHLRSIFRKERDDFRHHFRLSGFVGLGRRGCPSRYRNPNREKEFFLPGWRTDAKQPRWFLGSVCEGMRGVGWDIDGLSCSHD
jgi:hypothetical protein